MAIARDNLPFTAEEQAWLDRHPKITVGCMQNWAPICFADPLSKGISADYIQALNNKLNGRLILVPGQWNQLLQQLIDHKIDVLLDITPLPSRSQQILFTQPYLNIPHVIIGQKKSPLFDSPGALKQKIIALEKGFGNIEFFERDFPEVLIHQYTTTQKALEAVANGHADAYVGNRATAIYLINQKVMTNLKVHALLDKQGSLLSMGVRNDWPILVSILQKTLDSLTPQERQNINAKWVDLNIEESFSLKAFWRSFWPYIVAVIVFLSLILLWNFYLKQQVARLTKVLQKQINYDHLTGLPNRYLLQNNLGNALKQAKRDHQYVLVLACRIDSLEPLQKAHGSRLADQFIVQVVNRVQSLLREIDLIGSWSDNLLIMGILGLDDQAQIETLMQRFIENLSEKYQMDKKDVHCSIRLGGSIYPKDASEPETLINQAILAAQEAKKLGKKAFSFYSTEMNESLNRRILLNQSMTGAIERGELLVYYQPKINIKTGQLCSCEALLRWFHPQLGSISPDEFIPIAEENEQIITIGRYVLSCALGETKKWQAAYPNLQIGVAVNLSPIQLKSADLVEFIASQLHAFDFDPERLEIEITEGILLAEKAAGASKLMDIKALGVRLSMDDFGKGYSSLSYLRNVSVR